MRDLAEKVSEMEKVMVTREKFLENGQTELKQDMKELRMTLDTLLGTVNLICGKLT